MTSTLIEQINRPLLSQCAKEGMKASEVAIQFVRTLVHVYGVSEITPEIPAIYGRYQLLSDTVNAEEAALRYETRGKVTAEAVRKAAREGRILAIRGKRNEMRFPIWQFSEKGGVLAGFKEVLAELARKSVSEDMEKIAFFLNPNPITGGLSPIEVLRTGRQDAVMRAASATPY